MIIYTLGDPAGLGPELLFYSRLESLGQRPLLIVGPESILFEHSQRLGQDKFWKRVSGSDLQVVSDPGIYLFQPPELDLAEFTPGKADVSCGFAAGASLRTACEVLKNGQAHALVTGPINKSLVLDAGFKYGGHTELLADYFGIDTRQVCMHLCGQRLRVSLVTTHPPLRDVPSLVTTEKIIHCLKLTSDFVQALGLKSPIAVCSLNPHAGEQGKIGDEEQRVIIPALDRARSKGINARGPFAADTIFFRAYNGEFSAVLAMYHDQGLGPLKLVEFGSSVNITLGLPIVRTSVDHGTGYDLVGTGKACATSLELAVELAVRLSSPRAAKGLENSVM